MTCTARTAVSRAVALLVPLLLLGLCAPASAQWKWRDANGRIQYSDRAPPAGVPDKDVLQKPPGIDKPVVVIVPAGAAPAAANAPASTAAPAGGRQDPADAKRREAVASEEAQRAADQARLARQQAENCARAREYARTLDSGMRIARVDAGGERSYIDDAQRAQEAIRARDIIANDCK